MEKWQKEYVHNAVMFMKKQNTVFFAWIAEKQG